MKRIVFSLTTLILFFTMQVHAQEVTSAGINYASLESKLDKSEKNIENAKKNIKVKTWTDHAKVLIDIYNVYNNVLYKGMGTTEAKLMLKNPNEITSSQVGADLIEEYIYDRVTLTFTNGELSKWVDTKPIYENPLVDAEKAINKAIEVNTDGKGDGDIKKAIDELKGAVENQAIVEYEKKDFAASFDSFSKILTLNKLPVMDQSVVDSTILYNAGRTALESKNYKKAVEYFGELDKANYNEPFLYVYLEQSIMASGDTAAAVEAIKKGFNKYPANQAIMNEMINYYINTEQPDEALKLLSVAQDNDPENVSYYFAEAVMYEKIGNIEKAEEVYMSCLDKDPDFFDAAYNIGVLYYNRAVKFYEEASLTSDNNEFQKLDTEGDEMLKKAVPFMVRAHEINPTDSYVLTNLKNIYYRLEMTSEYNDVNEKLKALE